MNQKTPTIKGKIVQTIDVVKLEMTEDELFEILNSPFLNVGKQTYITPIYQILEGLINSETPILNLNLTRI